MLENMGFSWKHAYVFHNSEFMVFDITAFFIKGNELFPKDLLIRFFLTKHAYELTSFMLIFLKLLVFSASH